MTLTRRQAALRLKYHPNAYLFVFAALQLMQERLSRKPHFDAEDEEQAHISGQELLEGVRELACEQFGLLTKMVFRQWGVTATEDFGRMVFELVDRGEMRKTDRDSIDDFVDVYDFDQVFDQEYVLKTDQAFSS